MSRSGTCPFCKCERHDGHECGPCRDRGSECCGPNEEERATLDAPGEILEWLHERIVDEIQFEADLVQEATVYTDPDFIELETRHGRFKIRIERAS